MNVRDFDCRYQSEHARELSISPTPEKGRPDHRVGSGRPQRYLFIYLLLGATLAEAEATVQEEQPQPEQQGPAAQQQATVDAVAVNTGACQ